MEKNKSKSGEEAVDILFIQDATPPPPLDLNDSRFKINKNRHPQFDSRYKYVPKATLPSTEV
jgi:hypothetical protein